MDQRIIGNIIFWNLILITLFFVITRYNLQDIKTKSTFKIYNLVLAGIFWIFWIVVTIELIRMFLAPRMDSGEVFGYILYIAVVPVILLALVGIGYTLKYIKRGTK